MNPRGAAKLVKTPGFTFEETPPQPPELPSEDRDPFLRPLRRYDELHLRRGYLGYPHIGRDGRVVPAPWARDDGRVKPEGCAPYGGCQVREELRFFCKEECYWKRIQREQAPGPRPLSIKLSRPLQEYPYRARFGPYRWAARWTWRGASPYTLEVPVGPRVRRWMDGSLARMAIALGYLQVLRLQPTHLLTLTVPRDTWYALPRDLRPQAYRKARAIFLHRLQQALRRKWKLPWAGLRWDEFQKNGVPHLHAYLDLGGKLPQETWEKLARGWIPQAWRGALEAAGFVLNVTPRTRLEYLRRAGTGYALGYAVSHSLRKAHQKRFPYPGEWGRTWDFFGGWRGAVGAARRADRSAPVVTLDLDQMLLLYLAMHDRALGAISEGEYELARLLSSWLPLFQVVIAIAGGEPPDPDEVLRPYVGGFWRGEGEKELFRRIWEARQAEEVLPPYPWERVMLPEAPVSSASGPPGTPAASSPLGLFPPPLAPQNAHKTGLPEASPRWEPRSDPIRGPPVPRSPPPPAPMHA